MNLDYLMKRYAKGTVRDDTFRVLLIREITNASAPELFTMALRWIASGVQGGPTENQCSEMSNACDQEEGA